jgi:hypothetical protein
MKESGKKYNRVSSFGEFCLGGQPEPKAHEESRVTIHETPALRQAVREQDLILLR